MVRSYPCLPLLLAPLPQSSEFWDWVVHLSFVRSFLTLVVPGWLAGWGVGVAELTSISVPDVQVFFSSPRCAEGWKFSVVSRPSDHPAVPTTSIPTGFPCPLHSHQQICGLEWRNEDSEVVVGAGVMQWSSGSVRVVVPPPITL